MTPGANVTGDLASASSDLIVWIEFHLRINRPSPEIFQLVAHSRGYGGTVDLAPVYGGTVDVARARRADLVSRMVFGEDKCQRVD